MRPFAAFPFRCAGVSGYNAACEGGAHREGRVREYRGERLSRFDAAAAAEFILSDGAGAWAASTVCGANTRRYHALLCARLDDPPGAFVFLSTLEEALQIGGARFFLSTAEYPGTVYPDGFRHLESFRKNRDAEFVYEVAGVRLRKRVYMPRAATVEVEYELFTDRHDVTLDLRPLCAFRGRHDLTRANPDAMAIADVADSRVTLRPYRAMPALEMHFPGEFVHDPQWYRNVRYRRDRERGHGFEEDLMSPGVFSAALEKGRPVRFAARVEGARGARAGRVFPSDPAVAESASPLARALGEGLGDFAVASAGGAGILRGLPWHNEWARNAMLALPGYMATGEVEFAERVLSTWARRAGGGLLPRFIDDRGEPGPPDVEATLWFYEAVEIYLTYTKNYEWIRANVLDFMRSALGAVLSGEIAAACPSDDGLLYTSGRARTFAPADGAAVAFTEIQALYFNSLKVMEAIAAHFRDDKSVKRYHTAAKAAQRGFNQVMWDARHHMPIDSHSAGGDDKTPRPMCLHAVALSHPVLIKHRWEILLDMVEGALLTPLGLRGAPADSSTKVHFPGDSFEDARQYGGVWPQFLGAYLVAHTKAFGRCEKWAGYIEGYLSPLEGELDRGMIGHLPEFFDAAEPFTARGAPADAAAEGQLVYAFTAKVDPAHYGGGSFT